MIAQNLFDQVYNDGYSSSKLEAIVDYRKDKSGMSKDHVNLKDQIRKVKITEINKGLANACAIQ